MEKINPTEIIVDLFELRSNYMTQVEDKYERVTFDFHYHSLSAAISQIINKYKIKEYEIQDEISKRRINQSTNKFKPL